MILKGRTIIIGVTSSVAIHKAIDLVSQLVKLDASVYVVMTQNATKLVAPLQFRTISRNPVFCDLFAENLSWKPVHIELADSADLLAIVPATANIIGKLAHGIADDMLSTIAISVHCPILVAPAMNCHMYANPAVQENLKILKSRGIAIAEPDEGRLACGYEGKGRLQDISRIIEQIQAILTQKKDFTGKRVLVTAGPTCEYIDPVRFISNKSSGKMGYAIAQAAQYRGAQVTLISGPTHLQTPQGVELIPVETAIEMRDATLARADDADVIIMAAAVADYRPQESKLHKIKKTAEELTLNLQRNPDISMELGALKKAQILVGFAAETENEIPNAQEKLVKKNLDLIVANNVLQEGAGFDVDTNIVTLIDKNGAVEKLPLLPKFDVANAVLDRVSSIINT
jgi:phosphopantothenoylcysteine decarboxylase/phosphopantothenate--cysteine ligase